MKDWKALLKKVIPSPCFDRPFVCDGFPSASNLMVIGENPATSIDKDWWLFWNTETGFDYEAFLADYREKKETNKNSSYICCSSKK